VLKRIKNEEKSVKKLKLKEKRAKRRFETIEKYSETM
jgi:hypothetical protein